MGAARVASAEKPQCSREGYTALRDAIELYGNLSKFSKEDQDTLSVQHATLRAILAVELCPVTAEKVFSENPNVSEGWMSSILKTLGPYFPSPLTPTDLSGVAQKINCSSDMHFVCEIRKILLSQSKAATGKNGPKDFCASLGPTVMSEASAEFENSSGDFLTPMDNLAFLLYSCPDSFFAYMHEHPKEITDWLNTAKESLFWGDPKDLPLLKSDRSSLINFVEQRPTAYPTEKKEILQGLRSSLVRVWQ